MITLAEHSLSLRNVASWQVVKMEELTTIYVETFVGTPAINYRQSQSPDVLHMFSVLIHELTSVESFVFIKWK